VKETQHLLQLIRSSFSERGYEIQTTIRSEKYIRICSGSQAALKAFQALKTAPLLARRCQRSLKDYSAHQIWYPFGSPGILVYVEIKLPMSWQGRFLFTSLLDRRQPLGCRGRTLGRGSRVGSLPSSWPCSKVLKPLRGRLGKWSQPQPGYED